MLEVQPGSNWRVKTADEKLWAFAAIKQFGVFQRMNTNPHILNTVEIPGKYISVAFSWHFLSSTS